jgi:hypothetical protein
MSKNINWSGVMIQEQPEYTKAMVYRAEKSTFDPNYLRENVWTILPNGMTGTDGESDKRMQEFFGEQYVQAVRRMAKGFLGQHNTIRVDLMFAKLDENKYIALDDQGTKMQYAILGLIGFGADGQMIPVPPASLASLAANLGFLPPITMPLPYSTVNLLEEGKFVEAQEALGWLKSKPGNLLLSEVRATYALRELAPGSIYGTLTETIPIDRIERQCGPGDGRQLTFNVERVTLARDMCIPKSGEIASA